METATENKEILTKKPRAKRKKQKLDTNIILPTDFEGGKKRWVARNTTTHRRETLTMHNNFGTPMYYVYGTPYRQFENALEAFNVVCNFMGANLLVLEPAE